MRATQGECRAKLGKSEIIDLPIGPIGGSIYSRVSKVIKRVAPRWLRSETESDLGDLRILKWLRGRKVVCVTYSCLMFRAVSVNRLSDRTFTDAMTHSREMVVRSRRRLGRSPLRQNRSLRLNDSFEKGMRSRMSLVDLATEGTETTERTAVIFSVALRVHCDEFFSSPMTRGRCAREKLLGLPSVDYNPRTLV